MKHALSRTLAPVVLALFIQPLQAQQPDSVDLPTVTAPAPVLFDADARQERATRPPSLRPLRVAKWTVLVASAGAGIYGFVQNGKADDRFRDLEALCQAEQQRCSARKANGDYEDAEFEGLFDEVKALDGRSHTALLLSQVGVATGVVLFLLDLGNAESPDDIPFVPGTIRVGPGLDGRLNIGLQVTR